jgi:hypothetical protein
MVVDMRSSDDMLSEIYCSEEPRQNNPSCSKQNGPMPGYTCIVDGANPSRANTGQGKVRREAESCEPRNFGQAPFFRQSICHPLLRNV